MRGGCLATLAHEQRRARDPVLSKWDDPLELIGSVPSST